MTFERSQCLRGHPLNGANIRRQKIKGRWFRRVCVECERLTRRNRIIRKVHGISQPEEQVMYG